MENYLSLMAMSEVAGVSISKLITIGAFSAGGAVFLMILYLIIRKFLYICRPNQLLVFSGKRYTLADGTTRGSRVAFSGRHWRTPILEKVDVMDLTAIPIEVHSQGAYSKNNIPLNVRAIATIKISNDLSVVHNAIERFLGQPREALKRVARETLEGNLRGVLADMTPEEVNEDRLKFADKLANEVEEDFSKLGLHLDTLKIQHVTDDTGYLESIGRQKIAEVLKNAEVAESNAQNEANKQAALAKAEGEVASENADKTIVEQRNDQRRIAAELQAQVEAESRRAKAIGEEARFSAEQKLQGVRRQVEELRLMADVEIPADAERRAKEMTARGNAAPIEENGRALAAALELLAQAWAAAGTEAKDMFLIQQVERLMATIVSRISGLTVGEVHVIDPGDGTAIPNYVAGFPATVTAIIKSLRESTGVDIASILRPRNGLSGTDDLEKQLAGHPSARSS
jgi:flotillin